jgi:hypothetical protein
MGYKADGIATMTIRDAPTGELFRRENEESVPKQSTKVD